MKRKRKPTTYVRKYSPVKVGDLVRNSMDACVVREVVEVYQVQIGPLGREYTHLKLAPCGLPCGKPRKTNRLTTARARWYVPVFYVPALSPETLELRKKVISLKRRLSAKIWAIWHKMEQLDKESQDKLLQEETSLYEKVALAEQAYHEAGERDSK